MTEEDQRSSGINRLLRRHFKGKPPFLVLVSVLFVLLVDQRDVRLEEGLQF